MVAETREQAGKAVTGWQPRVVVFQERNMTMQISGMWRIVWPMEALRQFDYPISHHERVGDAESLRIFRHGEKPDLVLIPRSIRRWTANEAAWVQAWHDAGIAVVAEHDDHQMRVEIPEDERTYMAQWGAHHARGLLERTRATRALLKACDGCTVSTATLGSVVRQYMRPGAPVVVVPNAIKPDSYIMARTTGRREIPPLTLGWAGTPRMAANFEVTGMAQAWGAIARRYPEIKFVTIGGRPQSLLRYIASERIESYLLQAVDAWPYALINVDIACCPLEPSEFNVCKSPQKAWEFALAGAAVVCSPTVYADDQRLVECGGLLADGADEWEERLSRLIENEQERRERQASLERFVLEERSLDANLWRWPDAWRQIVGHARRGSVQGGQKRKKKRR